MWFHHPFPRWRADEWLLYVGKPKRHPAAVAGLVSEVKWFVVESDSPKIKAPKAPKFLTDLLVR